MKIFSSVSKSMKWRNKAKERRSVKLKTKWCLSICHSYLGISFLIMTITSWTRQYCRKLNCLRATWFNSLKRRERWWKLIRRKRLIKFDFSLHQCIGVLGFWGSSSKLIVKTDRRQTMYACSSTLFFPDFNIDSVWLNLTDFRPWIGHRPPIFRLLRKMSQQHCMN